MPQETWRDIRDFTTITIGAIDKQRTSIQPRVLGSKALLI